MGSSGVAWGARYREMRGGKMAPGDVQKNAAAPLSYASPPSQNSAKLNAVYSIRTANRYRRLIMNSASPRVSVSMLQHGKENKVAAPATKIELAVPVRHTHPARLHYRF